ncbi:MAG: hypothetical protein L7U83_06830 [Akkermansiaceae bacterium]|nr:hypothetical protein [Akkermansiaceae bacterium]
MKTVPLILRILGALALAAWPVLLWVGIDSFQTGIQQQVDGWRGENSFPYEAFGQNCIMWACIWGSASSVVFGYRCLKGNCKSTQT